jgi:hypothetical protein
VTVDLAADAVALQGAVDDGASDAEEVGQFGGAVSALPQEVHQVASWRGLSLGCLPRSSPLALATRMPSPVCSRITALRYVVTGDDRSRYSETVIITNSPGLPVSTSIT